MIEPDNWEDRLAQLRAAFDDGFALPVQPAVQDPVRFALIRAGGCRYAIRVLELAGVQANLPIVPLPAGRPGLLGLSGLQGRLVPIFDLAVLLGADSAGAPPRWIALCRAAELIGLGFEEFEGAVRAAGREVHELESAPGQPGMSRVAIEVESALVHVLDMPGLIARIGAIETTEL
jgi:chemotaxis signal transduction protein